MPPDSIHHSQHHRLQDTANGSDALESQLPDFQCIQRNKNWVIGQISLQDLCDEQEPSVEILIAFLPAESALTHIGAHGVLSKRFNIPAGFWTSLALDASGFFRSQEERNANDVIKCYSSQFRFLVKQPDGNQLAFLNEAPKIDVPYVWHRLGFSTYWKHSKCVVLCFDLPVSVKNSLTVSIPASTDRLQLDDPFSFHNVLMEGVVELFNNALWSWRNLIRNMEKSRSSTEVPQPDYELMHEMARHAIHSSEMLAMGIETITSIIQEHDILITENPSFPFMGAVCKQSGKDLRYLCTLLKSLHLRSKALEERLRNEINLAFNVVAQHDSRISMRIADATQVDSAAMKTIAMLGLVFLPGTYICAIFSTSFFNFSPGSDIEPQHWTVSEKFWVYWAFAIPVTGAIMLLWPIWQHWHTNRNVLKRPAKRDIFQEDMSPNKQNPNP